MTEYGNNYYINHCLGFGCYEIIDQRDLKLKCDNGLYICRACGSCCEKHKKSHPNGFCPDCGSPLILYQKGNSRFVYCSGGKNGCDFKYSESSLPKKFTLENAPVKKVGSNNYYGNRSNSIIEFPDDEIPF